MTVSAPLIIDFAPGSRLRRETEDLRPLPSLLREGPPASFVTLADGREIPLPTEQIVLFGDGDNQGRVGFGGMSFEGMEGERLVFWRVHDLLAEEDLAFDHGGDKMTLDPASVTRILVQGNQVWPRTSPSSINHI